MRSNLDIERILQLEKLPTLDRKETALVLGMSVGSLDIEIRSQRLEIIHVGGRGRRLLITKTARETWKQQHTKQWGA